MEDLSTKPLNAEKLERLQRTMSSDALWLVVMHHILTGKGMSIVRTGDMEPLFLMRYPTLKPGPIPVDRDEQSEFGEANQHYIGVHGIDRDEFRKRILVCTKADYLGMSISGYLLPAFDMSPWVSHPRLCDNYFSNNWTKPMIRQLLQRAKGVIVINRHQSVAESILKRSEVKDGLYMHMSGWRDNEGVCKRVCGLPHQLVILSAGAAGKYIAIEMAAKGKVVLDAGQSAWCYA